MAKIIIELEAQALIPTLEVYKQYFDAKYPCTDESNDGSNMSEEDLIKWGTYEYLLNTYEKSKDIYVSEYNKLKEKVAALEG
jgi:hypothetical protein